MYESGSEPGLSIRAVSRPKPPASQRSLAGYFHRNLPLLVMKNLTVIKLVIVLTKSAPASILSCLLHEEERKIFAKIYLV